VLVKVLAPTMLEILVMAWHCSTAVLMKELAPINNGGDFGGTIGADGGISTSWRWSWRYWQWRRCWQWRRYWQKAEVMAMAEVLAIAVLMEVLEPSGHGGEFFGTSSIDGSESTSRQW